MRSCHVFYLAEMKSRIVRAKKMYRFAHFGKKELCLTKRPFGREGF